MIGMAIGAGLVQRARRIAWTASGAAGATLGVIGVTLAIKPSLWVALFTNDPAVTAAAHSYFAWAGPAYAFFGMGVCLYFSSQGAAKVGGPVLTALLGAPVARSQTVVEPTGIWLTQAGDAKVRVSKCGGGICGVIVWLKEPIDPATGRPQVDDKNSNPALARRPMIGLPLFSGMRATGPGKWSGQIYNTDDGSTYASNVAVTGPDKLRVESCMGAFCGGETWTRVGH